MEKEESKALTQEKKMSGQKPWYKKPWVWGIAAAAIAIAAGAVIVFSGRPDNTGAQPAPALAFAADEADTAAQEETDWTEDEAAVDLAELESEDATADWTEDETAMDMSGMEEEETEEAPPEETPSVPVTFGDFRAGFNSLETPKQTGFLMGEMNAAAAEQQAAYEAEAQKYGLSHAPEDTFFAAALAGKAGYFTAGYLNENAQIRSILFAARTEQPDVMDTARMLCGDFIRALSPGAEEEIESLEINGRISRFEAGGVKFTATVYSAVNGESVYIVTAEF